MKKRKLLLALGIVTMLTLPTIQVHATDVDINTEEKNPDVKVEDKDPGVEVEEKDLDDEVADTENETSLGRNNLTWTDREGIRYSYNTSTLTGAVVGYTGGSRNQLTVPSTIRVSSRDITIIAINQDAFANAQIRSFDLPNTITTIGARAFINNSQLQSIVFPRSVNSIGDNAFTNCTLLSTVDLGAVTSIGAGSFFNCNIRNLTISRAVSHIGSSAFQDNSLTSFIIPDALRVIEPNTFANNNLTSVTWHNNITSIGAGAFRDNNIAGTLRIPNSVTTIGANAFVNNNITAITSNSAALITSIGSSAFANNNLTSVSLPRQVRTIGFSAFANNNLASISLPRGVSSIGIGAFEDNILTSVELPTTVTSIGDNAFERNQLTKIFIPNSVTSIGNRVFQHNPLTTIETDDGNADTLRDRFGTMGSLSVATISLIESSPSRYDANVQTEYNVLSGSNLELRTISQIKHVHNNNTGTWNTHTPVAQWYRNGTLLAGKNNATLSLSNLQESDSGIYHAVIDSTVLPNITVNVTSVYLLTELFPDINFAKAIAQELHGNENTNILVSPEELASIQILNLNGKGIENLKGAEYLVNVVTLNLDNNKIQDITPLSTLNKLQSLLLRNNHISNIKPLSTLNTLYDATNQTIQLPDAIRGEPTDLQLVNRDGSTPSITFVKGQGTYENGKLTWTTDGENQLTWQGSSFSGTVTQNVKYIGLPISTFFPDENLAKAIAQVLHSNNDISALTTETELATIDFLNIPNMGIKDLTGLDYLNLTAINAPGNHIIDISILSKIPNNQMYNFAGQTIQLPEGVRGEPTDLQLVGKNGSTPRITYVKGQGTYENGKLTWTTGGENQLTWQEGNFSGTLTQNVKDKGLPISYFFPDENLAKEIALLLNKNEDISALTTEEDLAKINTLIVPQKGIKDLTGIDYLKNLFFINASDNHISDIRILSKLPNAMYTFTNQTIQLPEGVRGQPTDISLVTINGTTPSISYINGEGTYTDGKLTWSSVGKNRLTWQSPQFTGTLTQTTIPPIPPEGQTIASLFPDENLAKEIALVLHGNQDTSVYVTDEQLLDIPHLSIPNKGIKNLSGIENLKNLMGLNISHNHIHDISMLSNLPNLMIVMAFGQTITLPEVTLGTPTKLTIHNEKGETPSYTFTVGQGTYVDDELRWTTAGENQLTWSSSSPWGSYDGKVVQNVVQSKQTIASIFPDTNFAQSIAMELHRNTDTSVAVTEQDLARIVYLSIPNRNIRSISGIENLHNLVFLSAEDNQITDISMLSKLPKLSAFYIAKQSVILSDVATGTPTPLTLLNHNGIVPQYELTVGTGSYNNGMLTWTTAGENKLTWEQPSSSSGTFDGVITQLTI
jgi:Leucine-rich repeat (LRR) protein